MQAETCEADPLVWEIVYSDGLHEKEAASLESSRFQPHQHGTEEGNGHPILFVLHL